MRREILAAVLDARRAKRPAALVTRLDGGAQALFSEADGVLAGDAGLLDAELEGRISEALRDDRSGTFEGAQGRMFVQVLNPPLRMAIVGAVHIGQALAPMAALLGYDVTVIDPRRAFASRDRFPGVEISAAWPDEALEALAPDRRTAVVTLTHDPKLDDPALKTALETPAFYIASLGSKRTHAKRLERLREAGFGEPQLARIHGPAGLAIGARSAAEIAAAILAQATSVLRGAATR